MKTVTHAPAPAPAPATSNASSTIDKIIDIITFSDEIMDIITFSLKDGRKVTLIGFDADTVLECAMRALRK